MPTEPSKEVPLEQWLTDESTGERVMYSRLRTIDFCKAHKFDKNHECQHCPYVFTGFKANQHIQKADGIYDRKTGKKLA